MHLQPAFVFQDEITRINEAYWLTRYSHRRLSAVLGAIAATGSRDKDPRVSTTWPSTHPGESRHITVPVSEFAASQRRTLASIRLSSLLHASSAFENALTNLFALGLMYRPTVCKKLKGFTAVPGALSDEATYQVFREALLRSAQGLMAGDYSKRVQEFHVRFNITVSKKPLLKRLDSYYEVRNAVAHDQGLFDPDQPDLPAPEVVSRRRRVPESQWKKMLGDYFSCIADLDEGMVAGVITDRCLGLAVRHQMAKGVQTKQSALLGAIHREWRLDRISYDELEAAVGHCGLTVRRSNNHRREHVVLPPERGS